LKGYFLCPVLTQSVHEPRRTLHITPCSVHPGCDGTLLISAGVPGEAHTFRCARQLRSQTPKMLQPLTMRNELRAVGVEPTSLEYCRVSSSTPLMTACQVLPSWLRPQFIPLLNSDDMKYAPVHFPR